MQKQSLKRYSLLGLVLLAASAVTAAMLPSKSDNKATGGFTLTASSADAGSTVSCEATAVHVTDPCTGATASDGIASASTTANGASFSTTDGIGAPDTTA